ncbi:right-handed parallel beta-helix repeat-containing protein [Fibrisoma montanum]|uniref:Right-handed parallel beta-helix repeat-containing protein n=1 Tax=Fibrisoma montanum TaxID=2305895 RepID=A0A418M418_9BACT|nr:right-handed parallel beta-helix repeat-containing protein [Fibrisoma montanum]RIV20512.1 right-handed parallel beta-helix repeat-containing protein [Fibrisoma montanum]
MKPFLLVCLLLAQLTQAQTIDTIRVQPGQRILIEVAKPVPTPIPDTVVIEPPVPTPKDSVVVSPLPSRDTVVIVKPVPKPWVPKVIISKSGQYDLAKMGVLPGDTVGIQGGNYTFLKILNAVGTAAKPVVFRNYQGVVRHRSNTANQANFTFEGCDQIVIAGDGVDSIKYGIRLAAQYKDVSALVLSGFTKNVEVHHVEVDSAGFAGLMAKTDPTDDVRTQRGNFDMGRVYLHHNYIHNVRGEGFYVGSSFMNSGVRRTRRVAGKEEVYYLYPHYISSLEIAYNITDSTGCEGIQYSCSPGARVHDNRVSNSGLSPFAANQNNGVQIGGLSSGAFYDNEIRNSSGIGLIIVGHGGDLEIRNVLIENSGKGNVAAKFPEMPGVFIDERKDPSGFGTVPATNVRFINVTIKNSQVDAVRLYNETQTTYFVNCVFDGFSRFQIDRSPKTVPFSVTNSHVGPVSEAPSGVGYQPYIYPTNTFRR